MRNTRLEEAQAGIKIARRNTNNLRYADDTTLMAESDQIRSVAQSCPTLCNPMNRSTPGLPVQHQLPSLLKLRSIESVMPANHLILCCPLLLPSISPNIRVFSNESALRIRWPKYWSLSFIISPCKEYSGLISFGINWFDLLAVQGVTNTQT